MPRVAHFDMMSEEPEKTIAFFGNVFGWEFRKWDGPFDYWIVRTGPLHEPGIDGGLSRGQPVEQAVLTMNVDRMDPVLVDVRRAGGSVLQPKAPIPRVGWFATVRGPDGNVVGLMEDDEAAS